MKKLILVLSLLALAACGSKSGSSSSGPAYLDSSLIVSQGFTTGNLQFDFQGQSIPSGFASTVRVIATANSFGDICNVQVGLNASFISLTSLTSSTVCTQLEGVYTYFIVAEGSGIQAYLQKQWAGL